MSDLLDQSGSGVNCLLMVGGAALLLLVSFRDVASRTLPDWCAASLAAIGLTMRVADGTWPASLAAASAVFALMAFCWHRGWVGGGDVKLLAACAFLVRPGEVAALVLATALAGGLLACIYVGLGKLLRNRSEVAHPVRPAGLLARIARVERWRIGRGGSLPYGCAIATAALYVLFGPMTTWR